MSPGRVVTLALALLAVLHGAARAQSPPAATGGEAVAPPAPEAGPPAPARGWFGEADAFAARPQNYFAYWGEGSKGLTVYRDVPPRWRWTVAPQAALGYQFADGSAFLASYRFLGSSADFHGDSATARSDLDSHWLDLDYRSRPFLPWETVAFQVQGGVRLGILDEGVRYQEAYQSGSSDRTFLGAGPHLGTLLTWNPGGGDFGLFARADVGVLVGRSRSRTRTHYTPPSDSPFFDYGPSDASESFRRTQVLVNPRVELGLNWRSPDWQWLAVEGGVRLDDFALHDHAYPGASIVQNVGPFFRCKLAF